MWSPLADLSSQEHLSASLKLPFPTGKESKVKVSNSQDSFFVTYDEAIHDLFEQETEMVELDGVPHIHKVFDENHRPVLRLKKLTPEGIKLLADFIELVNATGFTIKGKTNSEGVWVANDDAIDEWENIVDLDEGVMQERPNTLKELGFKTIEDAKNALDQIRAIIDLHNLYIRTADSKTRELMAKNKCQYEMYLICSIPSNLVELMVGVDVSTDPIKNSKTGAVALSPYNGDDKLTAPGNYFTVMLSFQEGQVGKDCVGIGAVSIKVNSTTQYYADKILWHGSAADKARLILPEVEAWGNRKEGGERFYNLGGVPRYGLLNLYDKNAESIDEVDLVTRDGRKVKISKDNPEELINIIASNDIPDDITPNVAMSLAAMLSVAVDNAKDLALAKINAGPKTFGFYAYGISMGMDIRDIAKIVNTPQGRAITKLCEGDITNGLMGAFSALQAIGKLEGNIARDLTQFDVIAKKGEYTGAVALNNNPRRTASEVVQTLLEDYYNNVVRKYNFKDLTKGPFIKRNKGKIDMNTKNLSNIVYLISVIGKMDDCLKYILKSPLWEEIFTLSDTLSNKDHWDASIYQLLDFCKNYGKLVKTYYSSDEGQEDFYYAKNLRILAQGAEEMRVLGTILSSNKGLKARMEDSINFINTIENAIIDRKKVMGIDADPEDRIDFVTFATDARYRLEAINKYETVRHTTNILDVVANAPHFLSYLRACSVPYAAFKMGSMKFRVRDKYYDKVIEENKLTAKADKDNAIRGIENAVNYRMLREWLADEQFKFVLPKGSKMFVGRNLEPITVEDDTIIPLWDDNGLATFKLYMDTLIIPNLKSNASYSHNNFVQGLIPFELTKTGTHAAITAYTLEGSMMPQTESQSIQMENYLADFSQMYNFAFPNSKVPGINNIPSYADAFYIYSQYVFSGRKGQRSLMSLFDSENCTLARHFESFEALKDANETYEFQVEDLLPWCAPNSNIYHPSANMFYATDSKNFGKLLYRQRKEKLDPTNDDSTATHMVVTRANKETAPIEARQNYTNPESNDAGSEDNQHKLGLVNANVIPYDGDPVILDENLGEMVDIVANEFSGSFQAVSRMPLSQRSQQIVDYVNNHIAEYCLATYDFESNSVANSISKVMLNALFEEALHQIDNDC